MDVRGERTGRRWFICNQLDMIRVEGLSASEHLCMWSRARGTGKQDTCRMRSRERGCRERNTGARRAGNSRMLWIIFVGILSAMSIWGFERISSFGVAVSTYSLCQSHLQTKKNRSPDCFFLPGRCVSRRPNARSCHPSSTSSSRHVGFDLVLSPVSLLTPGK